MKPITIITAIALLSLPFGESRRGVAQTPGEWTWMHGDNTPNSLGSFGVQGVPSPANKPPALYEPCEWKDNNGNFWLFGGVDAYHIGEYAALWKYDPNPSSPTYNQWTWMKGPSVIKQKGIYGTQGVPSPINYPGSRAWGVVTWVDPVGNLWLFGGTGYDAFGTTNGYRLNDLWKYDISSNEWTWMKGSNIANNLGSYGVKGVSSPTNLPPSRDETSCSWTDNSGNLWLYGGFDGNNVYEDLWKYDMSSNEWIWMQGAQGASTAPAVYGTQGLADSANTPGERLVYCSWIDLTGNLWLFGGQTLGKYHNDLWKYDPHPSSPAFNMWTWVKGPSTPNNPGNYGIKCVSTNNNIPPSRGENRARVRDACGNFWNFGGGRYSPFEVYNDLWHYNLSTSQWTWVNGDNIPSQAAVYGVLGVSNPANKPASKAGSVAWIDNKGYIWIFGGEGGKCYNDLFRYIPDSTCVPVGSAITISSNTTICIGQNATLTASGGTSYSWLPNGQTTSSIVASPTTTTTYTVIGSGSCGSIASSIIVIISLPPFVTISTNITICNGQSTTLTASGGTSYSWSPGGQTASSIVVSPTTSTTYMVTASNACGSDSSSVTVTVNNTPAITASSTNALCSGGSDGTATVVATGGISPYTYSWSPAGGTNSIATALSAGIYSIIITDAKGCTNTQVVTINPPTNAEELYLPNAFSPNDDGENDMFCLQGGIENCIKDIHITVYDRWGEEVFKSDDPKFCWDGTYDSKQLNTAVFVYYLNATFISGKTSIKKGNISLVR